MREVHRRAAGGDWEAQFAFEVWRHRIVTQAGACIAALGGLDALVFTGGIGEHDPIARKAVVDGLAWLGEVPTFVIESREDLQLAHEAQQSIVQREHADDP
jgi:acetate kinase